MLYRASGTASILTKFVRLSTRNRLSAPISLLMNSACTLSARPISSSTMCRNDAFGGFYNMPVAGLSDEQGEASVLDIIDR